MNPMHDLLSHAAAAVASARLSAALFAKNYVTANLSGDEGAARVALEAARTAEALAAEADLLLRQAERAAEHDARRRVDDAVSCMLRALADGTARSQNCLVA